MGRAGAYTNVWSHREEGGRTTCRWLLFSKQSPQPSLSREENLRSAESKLTRCGWWHKFDVSLSTAQRRKAGLLQHLALSEVLFALRHYPGQIDTLRQAKGFAYDHRQVSHEWLRPNEDSIVCVSSCPKLAQHHLTVFVPAEESEIPVSVPWRRGMGSSPGLQPALCSGRVASLVLAPFYLPFIFMRDLTSNLLTPQAFTQPWLNLELLFMEMKASRVSPLPLEIRGPLRTSEVTASTGAVCS